jgi:hypothetical protein
VEKKLQNTQMENKIERRNKETKKKRKKKARDEWSDRVATTSKPTNQQKHKLQININSKSKRGAGRDH